MAKAKVTLALDEELVLDLDRRSKAQGTNRSRLVEEAVRLWRRRQLEHELRAGYRSMAEEDRDAAEANLPAAVEVLE